MIRWLVHNCVAHPILGVAELAPWPSVRDAASWFHDVTVPP